MQQFQNGGFLFFNVLVRLSLAAFAAASFLVVVASLLPLLHLWLLCGFLTCGLSRGCPFISSRRAGGGL